jgi:hypothetical protein
MKKHFLAQFIFEVEGQHALKFDAMEMRMALFRTIDREASGEIREIKVYPLACMPDEFGDVEIQSEEYRGFEITIYQNADSVASDVPTFYAATRNLSAKTMMANIHGDDVRSIEEALAIGRAYVDKRKKWKRNSGD